MNDRIIVMSWLEGLAQDDWMLSFANACSGALELLEEQEDQEYVEPIPTPTDSSGWFFKCSKCSNPINWKDKFCAMCGKAVKWELIVITTMDALVRAAEGGETEC